MVCDLLDAGARVYLPAAQPKSTQICLSRCDQQGADEDDSMMNLKESTEADSYRWHKKLYSVFADGPLITVRAFLNETDIDGLLKHWMVDNALDRN